MRDEVDSKCIKSIKIEVIDKKGKEEINISTQFSNDKETIRILRMCLILLDKEVSPSSTNWKENDIWLKKVKL